MTPKEKAEELFEKFLLQVGTNCEHDSYCNNKECQYKKRIVCCVDLGKAKQCALIAVDLLIEEIRSKYWYDVKHEIEKL